MKICMVGAFVRNAPFGTEIAFAKGLRDEGVAVTTFDPSRQTLNVELLKSCDAVIIFKNAGGFNVHLRDAAPDAKFIVYQPDDIRAPGIENMLAEMRKFCDYAFTFDKSGAEVCRERLGYLKAEKLMVTADPGCYHPLGGSMLSKQYSFSFVGSISNPIMHASRRRLVSLIRKAGFQVEVHDGLYDVARVNQIYNESHVVVNHATDVGQQFGWGYGYQCRHFETAAVGVMLWTNSLLDDEGDGPKWFNTFDSERSVVENAEHVLVSSLDVDMCSARYWEFVDKHSTRCRAKQIIRFVESIS